MMMRNLRLRKLVAAAAALLTACTATTAPVVEAPPAAAAPALWKVADDDTTIYLFGTIHALPEGVEWQTPRLREALDAADTLVLEIANADSMETATVMAKLGRSPGLPPLLDRVPADRREVLAARIASLGLPAEALDQFETWAAALTLLAASFVKMGFSTELGADRQLLGALGDGTREVVGLETAEQQLGYFDALSEESQRELLVSVISDEASNKKEFEQMVRAWLAGDVDAIAETFNSEMTLTPELRETLLRNRNARWASWIEKRLDQPGTVLVAVGAGHLAGEDSVQVMLGGRGLQAQRVQ